MTIKKSGMISFTELNAETNHASNDLGSYRNKSWWFDNGVGGSFPANNVISFGAMYDKRFTNPGNQGQVTCEAWQLITSSTVYTVPEYQTLTVIGIGGGGGQGDEYFGQSATPNGGTTSFGNYCVASGGTWGGRTTQGQGGTATGGDQNYTGGAGAAPTPAPYGGSGGVAGGYGSITYAGAGGAGGPGSGVYNSPSSTPGSNYGGGSGGHGSHPTGHGASAASYGGGGGGAFLKVFKTGDLTVGDKVSVTVGAGGLGGPDNALLTTSPGYGGAGIVAIQRCYIPVIPGNVSYTVPGQYNFVVPNYNSLTVEMYGGGGGGGSAIITPGSAGNPTNFAGILNCGGGGAGSYGGQNGGGGAASGGDRNYTGGNGGVGGGNTTGGRGAAGGYGILARAGAGSPNSDAYQNAADGYAYGGGGGGGGGNAIFRSNSGSGAGGGGSLFKTFSKGVDNAPIAGSMIQLNVGAGGTGAQGVYFRGGNGSHGAIFIVWN